MAHTSRLSGFSDAVTATPVQADADRPQQDEAAAFERAAAHIQPSWAHLVPSEAASERLVDTRPERPAREAPGTPAARVGSASSRRRRQRDDSLDDFPRAVRDRRSAALWFALVTLAALGLAWALSDESLPRPETRATAVPADRSASTEPTSRQPSLGAAANIGAGVPSQAHAAPAPRLATPATTVTSTEHAAQPAAPRDLSDPARALPVVSPADPPSAAARTPAQAGAVPSKPVALTRPMLARTTKLRRPVGASASAATAGESPHQATALNAQNVADEATAELTMQVEQAAEPLLQLAPRPPVGTAAIGDNPYDDGL